MRLKLPKGAITVHHEIVCFANDWTGDPLSKTHLMRIAARDRRVLWVDSLGNRAPTASARDVRRMATKASRALRGAREVEPSLTVVSPLAVPWLTGTIPGLLNSALLEKQIARAARRAGLGDDRIVISFLPAAAHVFEKLPANLRVYYCVDDFRGFRGAGESIARLEQQIVSGSDLVICASEPLRARFAEQHPHVALVRHGVDFQHFRTAFANAPVHPAIASLPRPILAFVGLVAEWVDQELLAAVARRFRTGTLLIVGREDVPTPALEQLPNIVRLGRRPYAELPEILRGVDVALCTFREIDLTHAANPLKIREYLAAGLPVVSTPMPEVARLPQCRIASGTEAFCQAVDEVLRDGAGPSVVRSDSVRGESWESRWLQVSDLIDRRLRGESVDESAARTA